MLNVAVIEWTYMLNEWMNEIETIAKSDSDNQFSRMELWMLDQKIDIANEKKMRRRVWLNFLSCFERDTEWIGDTSNLLNTYDWF